MAKKKAKTRGVEDGFKKKGGKKKGGKKKK
jgi:hypothetical protein